MIIPSIDIRGGRAVQLKGGSELILTDERDPVEIAREFNRYGEVAVIDLDAALGTGDNIDLVRRICAVADARVGGGIRDIKRADELLRAGARRLIIGTAADAAFLKQLPADRVMVALDHRGGRVVDHGWTNATGETVADRARRIKDFCTGYLITFVDDEGSMGGMNPDLVGDVCAGIDLPITIAGGIATGEEAAWFSRKGFDVQVGMALYTGALDLAYAVGENIDFDKTHLVPTVVQDESGQILMLAFSSKESLKRALRTGRGVYFSRSRNELWEKGATSGNVQELIACRADCDRDALLFIVRQTGDACHTGGYSCFGDRRFVMERLFEIICARKHSAGETSYTAQLLGNRRLLMDKIREEAEEVTSAGDRRHLIWELADAFYMMSVLAADEGIDWREIEAELGGRHR